MSNLNGLFRQFVSTIANSANGFVNAFDDSKDGIVLKAEFQANMSQNKADWVNNWNGEASKYNDLIDSFWSSFDNIYKKGEIYDTNIQNAYALDKTESEKIEDQMDVFYEVNQIFDEALAFLTKYPGISNYIKGEVANHIIDNNIEDAENLLTLINNVINSNADSIKNILLQDLLKNGSLNLNYTAVDGYNPLNDANLMNKINSVMSGFSGGIEALQNYLENKLPGEIENINKATNAYLSDDAKLDPNNNYQIARLAAIYLKTAESMIPADLDEQQREKALARAKESAINGANELLGKQGYEDYNIAGACSNATSFHTGLNTCKFLATSAFSKFKDYISALSLSVTVDGGLYYTLIETLKENNYSEGEAQAIVQCLVDNGKDIPEYVALVESIAEQVYTSTEQPVDYYALITDAIVNGNMGTSTTSWLEYLEKEAGITKATGSTPGGNNPGGAEGAKSMSVTDLDSISIDDNESIHYDFNTSKQSFKNKVETSLNLLKTTLINSLGYSAEILDDIFNEINMYFNNFIDDLEELKNESSKQDSLSIFKYETKGKDYTIEDGTTIIIYDHIFSFDASKLKEYICDAYNNNRNSINSESFDYHNINKELSLDKDWSTGELAYDLSVAQGAGLTHIKELISKIKTTFSNRNYDSGKLERAANATLSYYEACLNNIYIFQSRGECDATYVSIAIGYTDSNNCQQIDNTKFCFAARNPDDVADNFRYHSYTGICLAKDCGTKNDRGLILSIDETIVLNKFIEFFNACK